MGYPSQGIGVKIAILEALENHTSQEKGLGYNTLFDEVRKKVGGSRRTFNKYLNELTSTGAVKKERDPRHKTGVTIYRTDAATQEQVLMDLTDRIFAMTSPPKLLRDAMDRQIVDEARRRGIKKKEDITDQDLREINESLRMWKMAQVSDLLGRHFRK